MTDGRLRRLLAIVGATAVLAAGAGVSSAPAAYPPKPKPKPLPRATCRISTIVDRRVAISCNAGRARAGKLASIKIGTRIVSRGKVAKTGRYLGRFTLRTRLTRGTRIQFLVAGKVVATIRA
jgi:hypothetical protein